MPLSTLLAWRLARGKRQNGLTAFMSASSTIGIAIGCFALIVILSVMNGFERELRNNLLAVIPHGEFTAVQDAGLADWQATMASMLKDPAVTFVQPVIKVTGLLQQANQLKAVQIQAVSAPLAKDSPSLAGHDLQAWPAFAANPHSILLGESLKQTLGVKAGDSLQLLLPQVADDGRFLAPKSVWLTVAGSVSLNSQVDAHLAMMHLDYAAELLAIGEGVKGLQLYFSDPFDAPRKVREIGNQMHQMVYMSDWTRTQGDLYQDILLVRQVVYVVLTLVIAVACFNIVSAQIMAVSDKQAEIAMLMTMGAGQGLIMRTFVYQGLINGAIGTLLGAGFGAVLSLYLSDVARWFEKISGTRLLSGDVYFIDFLPSQLQPGDVIVTVVIALLLTLLATFYPAVRAARLNPTEVLGH